MPSRPTVPEVWLRDRPAQLPGWKAFVGELIQLVDESELTRTELARLSGCSAGTLSLALRRHLNNFPTWRTASRVLHACGEDPARWESRYNRARVDWLSERRRLANRTADDIADEYLEAVSRHPRSKYMPNPARVTEIGLFGPELRRLKAVVGDPPFHLLAQKMGAPENTVSDLCRRGRKSFSHKLVHRFVEACLAYAGLRDPSVVELWLDLLAELTWRQRASQVLVRPESG